MLPTPFCSHVIVAATDPGIKRKDAPNQDCIGTVLPSLFQRRSPLMVLADGMGGHNGGQTASTSIVNSFRKTYLHSNLRESASAYLRETTLIAHQNLVAKANQNPHLAHMGSTLVACVIFPTHLDLINVGDSRAYICKPDKLLQVSKDQSLVAEMVRNGIITAGEVQTHPLRNQLTMSISVKRGKIEPVIASLKLEINDVILLCSDGLWGKIPEPLIHSISINFLPQEAAQMLINLANQAGGDDNISVIIAMPKRMAQKLRNDHDAVKNHLTETDPAN
jgi:serine/threonine protein phosphatase PrpC